MPSAQTHKKKWFNEWDILHALINQHQVLECFQFNSRYLAYLCSLYGESTTREYKETGGGNLAQPVVKCVEYKGKVYQ